MEQQYLRDEVRWAATRAAVQASNKQGLEAIGAMRYYSEILEEAAAQGNTEVMEWAARRVTPTGQCKIYGASDRMKVLTEALKRRHSGVLAWMEATGNVTRAEVEYRTNDKNALWVMACGADEPWTVETARWLRRNRVPAEWGEEMMRAPGEEPVYVWLVGAGLLSRGTGRWREYVQRQTAAVATAMVAANRAGMWLPPEMWKKVAAMAI